MEDYVRNYNVTRRGFILEDNTQTSSHSSMILSFLNRCKHKQEA